MPADSDLAQGISTQDIATELMWAVVTNDVEVAEELL